MELPSIFDRYKEAIEEELRRLLEGYHLPLYQMVRYHMGWVDEHNSPTEGSGGKRLRPTLCLMACEAAGGDYRQALPAAAAVELIHNFSLIHDDIQDGSPERRNRPAVWWVWGPSQGINAGDCAYALGALALLQLEKAGVPAEKIVRGSRLLGEAALRLCEGQYLDLVYQDRVDISIDSYVKMVEGKTGALMGCACELGALLESQDQNVTKAFRFCGEKLGLAFQIKDDILDLWEEREKGKPLGTDIAHRKKVFPVVYALEQARDKKDSELLNLYRKRALTDEEVLRVIFILESTGCKEVSQKKAWELCQQGLQALKTVNISKSMMEEFEKMATFLVERTQ